MKLNLKLMIATLVCLTFSYGAFAQSIGRLMELEAKVAEKKMLDDLEKSSNQNAMTSPISVPPIALSNNTLPRSSTSTPTDLAPKKVRNTPYTVSILGVEQDLKADVVIGGRQYQAIKGLTIGEYIVRSIEPTGVWLETQVVIKRKGKQTVDSKRVFAPLSPF